MKNLILIFLAFALIACGEESQKEESTAKIAPPNVDSPELPLEPETPVDPEEPIEPETPVDPEEPVEPETPPTPGAFTCFRSAQTSLRVVFCTGGNLGNDLVELDLIATFTGGNPAARITAATVTNNVIARNVVGIPGTSSTPICSQPNGAGCFPNSSCTQVTIRITGVTQDYIYMHCGNSLDRVTRKYVSQ